MQRPSAVSRIEYIIGTKRRDVSGIMKNMHNATAESSINSTQSDEDVNGILFNLDKDIRKCRGIMREVKTWKECRAMTQHLVETGRLPADTTESVDSANDYNWAVYTKPSCQEGTVGGWTRQSEHSDKDEAEAIVCKINESAESCIAFTGSNLGPVYPPKM